MKLSQAYKIVIFNTRIRLKYNASSILRDKVDGNIYSLCKSSTDKVINTQVFSNVLNLIKNNV